MSSRYSKNLLNRNSSMPPDLQPNKKAEKASDFDLYVKGVPFYLCKETLAKRSAKVTTLLECDKLDELRWIIRDIDIDWKTFELVARFCYGYEIQLSSENIVSVLCVAYYLEMNDDHSSNNLLSMAIAFLEQRVLTSWNETMEALRVCSDKVLDKVADLRLIEVCLDSLVQKALKDPSLLEDLVRLPLRLYEPLILESSKHDISIESLVVSVCNYAKRWVFERYSRDEALTRHKRDVIEAVEKILPHERVDISCGFLFESLKASIFLDASPYCRKGFEVRISKQLHTATSKDLMILLPKEDGSFDIELLKTILKGFYNYCVSDVTWFVSVARMLEKFLFEAAASNACLSVETFKALAEIVVSASCEVLRYSDGIYKAIDVFLEMHKGLTESEKIEACRVLDCKKLSPAAFEHASKNEKLPLRIVVQVLCVSQMQIRNLTKELKGVEEEKAEEVEDEVDEEEDDEMKNMCKSLLTLDIESDYRKKRKIVNGECVVHCAKRNKVSVWKEVKRKFGCLTSSTVDACNCHSKKRNKTSHHYK